ncbi:putative short-chain dehydrogenase/reductase family protein [Aspergillus clavatus NRRL 1]|uniref:Short-chain dehydrogenase/reductase family protein, putative n=1 Tax=Aspergillus clavatus (strain ATCC 1007 / CBS 513.65 / DSM 816 / NCTC 3887 / NRRL 1 / QM 1276 / 107) TaxID=344612 RepID=A1CR38_ASPCL|nr:short-chain dehydrogenase/reductase family protein, putative [Aspergillus clavatus NRRL 1]EAW08109.1 short-chain dehydrogenase/reductase family protein, putative [Aspergillus clavatus NRRL 1]
MSAPSPRIVSTSTLPASHLPEKKWHEHLTLDLLMSVLNRTLFHAFVAWVAVLSLRAQAIPYAHISFIIAAGYAAFLTILTVARAMNQRLAYGLPRPVDLSEEVVVVTGGASGLGLLIARIYGLRGVSVAVLDIKDERDIDGWEEVSGVDYYRCDIAKRNEVEATAMKIKEELGTPTVLINCAAARINGQPLLSLPTEAFQKTIQTNLLAVFHTCQVLLPGMLSAPNGGTIVNVSSVLGHLSAAGFADYSASKAGLSALHRTLEAELQVSGNDEMVKMLLVETGQMSTPLFESVKTPNKFLAPVLETVHVAQKIVSAIDEGRGGVIRLPTFATFVNWYAVLPASLQRFARYLSGIDHAAPSSQKSRIMKDD